MRNPRVNWEHTSQWLFTQQVAPEPLTYSSLRQLSSPAELPLAVTGLASVWTAVRQRERARAGGIAALAQGLTERRTPRGHLEGKCSAEVTAGTRV